MTDLQKWLKDTQPEIEQIGTLEIQSGRERLCCPDGWSISIQAGRNLYSTPRINNSRYYEAVELGFPSWPMLTDLWNSGYQEEKDTKDTVWAFVPVDLVEKELKAHGWKYEEVI